jgi:hypothetical protein
VGIVRPQPENRWRDDALLAGSVRSVPAPRSTSTTPKTSSCRFSTCDEMLWEPYSSTLNSGEYPATAER